jgi:hypothetical protein
MSQRILIPVLATVLALTASPASAQRSSSRGGVRGGISGGSNNIRFNLGFGRGHHGRRHHHHHGFFPVFASPFYGYYSPFYSYGYPYDYGYGFGLNSFGYGSSIYHNVRALQQANAPAVVERVVVVPSQSAPPQNYERQPGFQPVPERRPEAPKRVNLVDAARRQVRVESVEPGLYLVRWNGPTEDLASVEFQAVDGAGQSLGTRLLKEAPFRGLLRVPEKTKFVLVTLEEKDGSSASIKLPVSEFKALDEK